MDSAMSMDAWNNKNVRQKDMLTEIGEFAEWFD